MNDKAADELIKEFEEGEAKHEVSPLLNFSVAPGLFGEITVTDSKGTVTHMETAVGVNMKMDTATLIKLYKASSSQEMNR